MSVIDLLPFIELGDGFRQNLGPRRQRRVRQGPLLQATPQKLRQLRDIHRMADGLTVISPVQKGSIWRVRITWPNGLVHHFGEFISEKQAKDWIIAHPWLAERQTMPAPRPAHSVKPKYRRGRRLDPALAVSA